jgi:hypothetical protein
MLRAYEARQQRRSKLKHERQSQLAVLKKQRRGLMTRALMLGLLLGLSGIFFAVVLSILIYGT